MSRRRRKLIVTPVIPPTIKFITTDGASILTTDAGSKLTTGNS